MAEKISTSSKFDKIARVVKVPTVRALNRAAPRIRDYIKTQFMGASKTTHTRLARNTGRMERNTTASRAEQSGDVAKATIWINVPYATTHFTDTGKRETIIHPVSAKALTIPILRNAQNRAPKAARDYNNTFVRGGTLYATERNKGVFPIFALRSFVKVPTRVDIQKHIQPYAEQVIKEELQKEIDAALK